MEASTRKLEAMLGLSQQRIGQLAATGVLVRLKRGVYDLEASVRGYIEFLRAGADGDLNPAQERAKLHKAQRKLRELELAVRKGELVDVQTITDEVSHLIVNAKTRLLALPATQAAYLEGKSRPDIESQLTDAIRATLFELAEWADEQANGTAEVQAS